MKKIFIIAITTVLFYSCGDSAKDKSGLLNDKKAELEKLKTQQSQLAVKIDSLQNQINQLDTSSANRLKPKLVALEPVTPVNFIHYIDLQGKIDATNMAYVSPLSNVAGVGGVVTALYIKEGDVVHKGQLIAKTDDQLIRQQLPPLQVQLATAEDTYKRSQNLWSQGIGQYQQVLGYKTQVETLQKQIDIIKKQIELTKIFAPMSGVADVVNTKIGQSFSPNDIRIVNTSSLKVTVNVPENYSGKVNVGGNMKVSLENDTNRIIHARINIIGKTIDPISRTFYVEAPIPSDPNFKPNQVVVTKLQDYSMANAITVPLNTLQNDENGKYILVAITENNKLIARKKYVIIGELYGNQIQIKSGINAGDKIIVRGYQGLYDGQPITTG